LLACASAPRPAAYAGSLGVNIPLYMTDYSVRLRLRLSPRRALGFPEADINMPFPPCPTGYLRLVSGDSKTPIAKSKMIILRTPGFETETAAMRFGHALKHALRIALARLHIGADFGEHSPKHFITDYGIKFFAGDHPAPALRDEWGPMAFPSVPPPIFANPGNPTVLLTTQPDRFERALKLALARGLEVPEAELLAFELFSGSQFEVSERARFLSLLMAIESLLPDVPREPESLALVAHLLSEIKTWKTLDDTDRASLLGAVSRLRSQSTRTSAKALLRTRLGERHYHDKRPAAFFDQCYNLRNRLVHGSGHRPDEEVRQVVGQLEFLVADTLAHGLLDIDA
jgi:hypothetical protein